MPAPAGIRFADMPANTSVDPNFLQLDQFFEVLNPAEDLAELFARVRREDLGEENVDVTTSVLVDSRRECEASIVARDAAVVAGLRAVPHLIDAYFGPRARKTIQWKPITEDGAAVYPGDVLARLSGPLARLLVIERPILNLLARLSGIATLTSKYAAEISGTKAAIFDTRKTTPGLRRLEKYAVRCGGGRSHRIGLYDAVLVKDNHLAGVSPEEMASFLDSRLASVRRRRKHPVQFIEVEVDSIEQLEAVLQLPAGRVDIVLLDNMSAPSLSRAVALRDKARPEIELEASGGVTLANVRAIASSGVERISIGALTHSAPALDIAMDLES